MEDNLFFFENGRWPQFLENVIRPQFFWKDDINFLKMDDDLNFSKMEDNLIVLENWRQPQSCFLKMEEDLICYKLKSN